MSNSYSMVAKAGLTAGDWGDWHPPQRHARGPEHIPSMLDPDDPGEAGIQGNQYAPRSPPIPMHIGAWCRDEHGNRYREIMSEETYADRNY